MTFTAELRTAARKLDDPEQILEVDSRLISDLLEAVSNTSQLGSATFCAALKLARSLNSQKGTKAS